MEPRIPVDAGFWGFHASYPWESMGKSWDLWELSKGFMGKSWIIRESLRLTEFNHGICGNVRGEMMGILGDICLLVKLTACKLEHGQSSWMIYSYVLKNLIFQFAMLNCHRACSLIGSEDIDGT